MPLIHFGDPRLNKVSEDISFEYLQSTEYNALIKELLELHEKSGAIGFAAPQLGVNKNIIVIGTTKNTVRKINFHFPVQILINPKIISHSNTTKEAREGCLSLPNIVIGVPRYTDIQVSHMSIVNGSIHIFEANDLVARVIQHEIDHLNGINFLSRSKNINSLLVTQNMTVINE